VEVAKVAFGADDLTEQERAPVAETRDVPAELVPGVGLRDRPGSARQGGAHQQAKTVGAPQPLGVEAQLGRQRLVECQQPRVGSLLGPPRDGQLRQLAGEAVAEGESRCRCDAHAVEDTWGWLLAELPMVCHGLTVSSSSVDASAERYCPASGPPRGRSSQTR